MTLPAHPVVLASTAAMTGTGLPLLTLIVCFGAVVPIVPTGAAVSASAVVAFHHAYAGPELAGVVLAGALGAYLGDVAVYALLRWGGERFSDRIRSRAGVAERVEQVERRIEEHQVTTLLVSRLIPGGRVPILLGAAVGGYPLRTFVTTDLAAAGLWSVVYAGIGVAGGAIFPHPWEGIVLAVGLALAFGGLSGKVRRRPPAQEEPTAGATSSDRPADSDARDAADA